MAQNLSRASHRFGSRRFEVARRATALALMISLGACNTAETFTQGQKIDAEQLDQVPVGSSREQVLLALGTPTTTGLVDGEALYYISQTTSRAFAFQKTAVKDRRILVVYLDDNSQVRQIAEYGLKDGKVFDYLSRKTRTSGADLAFVSQLLGGLLRPTL